MKAIRRITLLIFFSCICHLIYAQPPMMGWSSWNANFIDINEPLLKETADYMVSLGLKDAGYTWVNTDDGYFGGRGAGGNLLVNSKFPNGMKVVADYIHSKGLNAGIYSEIGKNTCGYYWPGDSLGKGVGLYGHEEQDLRLFFKDWGYDFIKVDYCEAHRVGLDEEKTYTKVADIIGVIENELGRDLKFNVCRWAFPGTWVTRVADSWRMHGDIVDNFSSIKSIIEDNIYLAPYASPGRYNDMDMLQVGRGLNLEEEKTHFGMWSIMSSPLIIGCNLKGARPWSIDILKNKEVIAVNQDLLGLQAELIARNGNCMVFSKPVEVAHGKVRAVALLNSGGSPKAVRVLFKDLQLSEKARVRDLWTYTDLGEFTGYYETIVPAHGTAMLRIEGDASFDRTRFQGEYAYMNNYTSIKPGGARFERVNGLASGGYRMIGLGNSPDNWAEFKDVFSSEGGKYTFRLFYYCEGKRNLSVIVNGKEYLMKNLNSGGVNKRAEADLEIELIKGKNVIRLANTKAWAPDIDKFELIAKGTVAGEDDFDMDYSEITKKDGEFPVISSEDKSNETWYYIRFKDGEGVLQDMGEDTNLMTKELNEQESAQQWKVVKIPNITDGYQYRIINKSGHTLSHVACRETVDGFYQTTNNTSSSVNFRIVPTENPAWAPGFELERKGAQGRRLNQFGSAGFNRNLSEWTADDHGNPVCFVKAGGEQ